MPATLIVAVFALGYLAIVFEHPLKLPALLGYAAGAMTYLALVALGG